MKQRRSVAALAAGVLGVLGALDALSGPVLAHFALVKPLTGFLLFAVGLLEGLLALLVGAFGLWATRAGSGRRGRGLAWLGLACGAALLAPALLAGLPGRGLPRINDITTNPDDAPSFLVAEAGPYPAAFAPLQRAAYPELAPIRLAAPADAAFSRARQTAASLGWELVEVQPESGLLEARATSRLFRFVDDVVVRVRPAPGGSVVDLRSRSRDGRGDLGANASRIRAFADALR